MKPGDIVRVKVMEVDKPRKRISLSLRLDDEIGVSDNQSSSAQKGQVPQRKMTAAPKSSGASAGGAFADAFRRADLTARNKRRLASSQFHKASGYMPGPFFAV